MINSVFVMSGTGEVLIEKHYRGVVSRTCCDLFWNEVLGATACASGGVWGSGVCVCVCVCVCVRARAHETPILGACAWHTCGAVGCACVREHAHPDDGAHSVTATCNTQLALPSVLRPCRLTRAHVCTRSQVQAASTPSEVKPVLVTPKYYVIHVQRYGMFFIAVVQREVAPLLVTEFLHRVVDVFRGAHLHARAHVRRRGRVLAGRLGAHRP